MLPCSVSLIGLLLFVVHLTVNSSTVLAARPIRVLLDQPPATLNPRFALDAIGQRLGALMFRSLVRISPQLEPEPDAAQDWKLSKDGLVWTLKVRDGETDHSGAPITRDRWVECLENYRVGKPTSPLIGNLPYWKATRKDPKDPSALQIELSKQDVHFLKNLSLFRYFRQEGNSPCAEWSPRLLWGSGTYQVDPVLAKAPLNPIPEILHLIPHAGASSEPLELRFVKDESTRVLIALKGEVDLLPNAVGLSKARWLQKKKADHYSVLEPEGIAVSYLALNLTHPILSKKQVRRALQMAIPRNEILKNKFFGFGRPASSFLSPKLPEAWHTEIPYDPEQAEELLDQAGFPRKNGKSRFRLHYKTTPSREGQETALMLRDAWHKIGVEIDLEVVEASIFFASVRKGSFELYSARWVGVSDGSIFHRTLHSQGSDNRVRFHHPQMDVLLDRAAVELIPETRKVLYQEVQKLMIEEAPYSPLWFWDQAIFLSKELIAPPLPDWSLAGSFEAWKKLRWKEPPK